MGQKGTVKLMNTMEDFYGLNEDHYTEEYIGLSPETAAALQESLGEEHPMNVEARSIRCYNGREDDHKAQKKVQNRRGNISVVEDFYDLEETYDDDEQDDDYYGDHTEME